MFYTWGCLDALHMFIHPLYVCMHPVHLYAPRGVHTPICPPYSSVHLYVLRAFVCYRGLEGVPLHVGHPLYTSTLYGVPPLQLHPLHSIHWLPHASVCFGDIYVIWGIFPLYWGFEGCSPCCWGFGGISTWGVHMLILVHSCSSLCLTFLLWL